MACSCEHLNKYLLENGSRTYNLINLFYISTIAKGSRKRKATDLYCHTCEGFKRLHACLQCSYFGCYSEKHIHNHSEKHKHFFGVEMTYGAVYCFICKDYMYHAELMTISQKNKVLESKVYGIDLICSLIPSSEEVQTVKEFVDKDGIIQGLRGIKNFGNTCYISSIVQVLIHTPLLREYFLSDKHVCNSTDCMMCEMANLFQEFYSGKQKVLLPTKLIYLVKKYLPQFQTNDQQDIDEFLPPFIDVLCKHSKGISDEHIPNHVNPKECECIMHNAFSWLLREDTFCQKCSTVSSSNVLPECLIRLQIETDDCNGGTELKTVQDCLELYTSKRELHVSSLCKACNEDGSKRNQVTVKRLPIIACFLLQRIAHEKTDAIIGKKSETFRKVKVEKIVELNDSLDMSKFMSPEQKNSFDILTEYDKRYSLYAVVCHKGNEDCGHCIAYIKINDGLEEEWYECNDDVITMVDREKINSLQGYMCFYHKRILDYDV